MAFDPLAFIEALEEGEKRAGEFIRNGPDSGLPGYVRDGYRKRCDQFANVPAWARAISSAAGGGLSRVCQPYWDDSGRDGPVSEAPFPGGQCEGVVYNVNVTGTLPNNPPQTFEANIIGPLRYNAVLPPIPDPTGCPPGQAWQRFSVSGSGGGTITWVGCNANLTVNSVNPLNGGANNCGDPPPVLKPGPNPPPDPGPIDGPEPTDDPGRPFGPPFLPLPPYQDPIGGPVPIQFPEFPGVGTGDGDGGDGGGGGGGSAPPPGDVGSPGTPQSTGDGGGAEGEAPEGEVLVGLRVVLTAFPPSRTKLTSEVLRGAYYAYMGVPGLLDLDPAGAAVTADQFIFAEQPNLTAWRLRANRGYNATVTPYYRIPE